VSKPIEEVGEGGFEGSIDLWWCIEDRGFLKDDLGSVNIVREVQST
jgi:hypothetical protein